jgi:hypothetical protein
MLHANYLQHKQKLLTEKAPAPKRQKLCALMPMKPAEEGVMDS